MSKNVKSVMERIAEIDKERASLIQEHNETKAKLAEDVRSTPEIVDLVSKVKENNMKIATEIDGMTLTIRPANDTVFATGRGQKYVVTDMSNGNEYRGTQTEIKDAIGYKWFGSVKSKKMSDGSPQYKIELDKEANVESK